MYKEYLGGLLKVNEIKKDIYEVTTGVYGNENIVAVLNGKESLNVYLNGLGIKEG